MNIPSIQIRTQMAKIGIETTRPLLLMEQPRATFEMKTTRPQLNYVSPKGELSIDQSKAWDALTVGGHFEMLHSIYSSTRSITLQTIGRIAQEGDQMMAIHTKRDAIADIAASRRIDRFELAFAGPASVDNVDIDYRERKVEFDPVMGEVQLHSEPNFPRYELQRGTVNISMLQYPKVEIIPPQLDVYV